MDDDLGRRLAGALHQDADHREPPAGAWSRFRARVERDPGQTDPHRRVPTGTLNARRSVRWRIPLIAAAAVTAIAVATAAIVTGGFGTVRQPVPAGPGGASGVTVTVAAPPDQPSSGAPVAGSLTMSFVGGKPPAAALRGVVTAPDGTRADAGRHTSDRTPLGYLTVTGDGAGGHFLWGAVGPDVLQVQIGAVPPADPGDIDPGFHAGPNWIIDSGTGTPWSLPEAATTVWTDLGDGWHGFAVRIPADATQISAIALGTGARMLQNRVWDPATGSHFDPSVAGPTGSPPGTAGTGPEFSSVTPSAAPHSGSSAARGTS